MTPFATFCSGVLLLGALLFAFGTLNSVVWDNSSNPHHYEAADGQLLLACRSLEFIGGFFILMLALQVIRH